MKTYKRLLHFIRPYTKTLIIAILSTIVVSGTEGATAWLVKPVLDDIFIKKDVSMLKLLALAVIVLFSIKCLFRFISSYLMSYAGHKIVMDIRNTLFIHIQSLSMRFFADNRTGGLLSRLINDVGAVQGMVSNAIKDMFREFFTMVILIGVLFYRDWKLAMVSVFVLPASGYLLARIGNRLRYLGKKGQEKIADISSILVETFTGMRVIKAFGREEHIIDNFVEENMKFFTIMKKTIKYRDITTPLIEFVGAIGFAGILWYGGGNVIAGKTTVGNFFSFITALLMLYSPIRRLSNINNSIQHASAAAKRIFELLDTETDIKEKEGALTLEPFSERIEFNHIYSRYDSDMVLHDICLTVHKGETAAIVGVSGVGKTTLIELIPRFHDVIRGSITIDSIDIRDVTLHSLRKHIGIVTQETFLFNDTIRNNIAFGDLSASDEKVISAAKMAYADQFITELPEQYRTIIGERGVKLSGGERQRIAIARAILKDPEILILDEATSALDTESEQIVQQALNNLMKNRTTFVIAHRFSTIFNADQIIVMENGKISEIGRHNELLNNGGAYKKVFDRQFAVAH